MLARFEYIHKDCTDLSLQCKLRTLPLTSHDDHVSKLILVPVVPDQL